MHVFMYVNIYVYVYIYMCTFISIHIHISILTYIYTHTHTQAHKHTHTNAHTHTHTHTTLNRVHEVEETESPYENQQGQLTSTRLHHLADTGDFLLVSTGKETNKRAMLA